MGEWKAGHNLPVLRLGAVPGGAGSAGDGVRCPGCWWHVHAEKASGIWTFNSETQRDFRAYVSTGKDDFEGNYTEKVQGLGLFIQKKEGKGDAAPVRMLRSCCLEVAPRSE